MTSNRLHIPIILATLLLASCSSDDKTLVIRDSDSSTMPHIPTEPLPNPDKPNPPVSTCPDECFGTISCSDEHARIICRDQDNDGCREWVNETCPENTICQLGECVSPEIPADPDHPDDPQIPVDPQDPATKCSHSECENNTLVQCNEDGTTTRIDCGTPGCDSQTLACIPKCTASKCEGNSLIVCNSDGTTETQNCGAPGCDSQTLACIPKCTASKCEGNTLIVCNSDGTSAKQDCGAPGCDDQKLECNGKCQSTQCSGNTLIVCNNDGTTTPQNCGAVGCDSQKQQCNPKCKSSTCEGSVLIQCNDDGTTTKKECGAVGCTNGACNPKCKESQCSGNTLIVCNANGTTSSQNCPNGCDNATKSCKATAECKYTSVSEVNNTYLLPGEATAGKSESTKAQGFTDEYLYDATNYIKIGARREWGGSIIFFGLADGKPGTNGSNTIDGNDTGREVQVAIYDASRQMQNCAYNASCASGGPVCQNSITFLGWNPVQGGNRCNIGSGIDSVSNKNGIMEIVTTPLFWNPNWDAKDCTSNGCSTSIKNRKSDVRLTQRLRFVKTHIVELSYSVQNLADLNHTESLQELPTLYTANGKAGPDLYRLLTSSGKEIPIDKPANDGFFVKDFTSEEPWVTLQNADLSYGVGILYENGLLEYQGWQNRSLPFNNVRSKIKFALPAHGIVQARAYLILGSYETIRGQASWLLKNLPPFGVLDVPAINTSVNGKVSIAGWALDNKGVKNVYAIVDDGAQTPLTYGTSRPDVCKVWVGYPGCSNVGFEGTVSFEGLSSACKHKLEIVAQDTDGNTRVIARRLITLK